MDYIPGSRRDVISSGELLHGSVASEDVPCVSGDCDEFVNRQHSLDPEGMVNTF